VKYDEMGSLLISYFLKSLFLKVWSGLINKNFRKEGQKVQKVRGQSQRSQETKREPKNDEKMLKVAQWRQQ
jgi:hypothetical protein